MPVSGESSPKDEREGSEYRRLKREIKKEVKVMSDNNVTKMMPREQAREYIRSLGEA